MDQNKTDLIMQFFFKKRPISAECNLHVHPDDIPEEFAKHAGYHNQSNFFEISNFQMGLKLNEQEGNNSALAPQTHLLGKPANGQAANARVAGPWARWRSATRDEGRTIPYPVEVNQFSFDRWIDAASPILFEACCRSWTFDKAILIKRVSQGHHGATSRPAVGYLRLTFTEVLITSINWDDGDMVKEQCEFICRELEIKYRPQVAEGGVVAAMPHAVWKQDTNGKAGRP